MLSNLAPLILVQNIPSGLQWLTWPSPLLYYLVSIRDVWLTGRPIGGQGLEYGMMAVLGVARLLLSLRQVK